MSKPRQERMAVDNLVRQGFETFLPMLGHWKRVRGQWQYASAPMFPRYLLLAEPGPLQSLAPIRSTYGVSTLLRFGETIATIAPEVIDALRLLEAQRARAPQDELSPIAAGMSVLVAEGPLKGLTGLVTGTPSDRVELLLSLMGRETRVVMACHQVVLQPA